jgi:hypothetical protein
MRSAKALVRLFAATIGLPALGGVNAVKPDWYAADLYRVTVDDVGLARQRGRRRGQRSG